MKPVININGQVYFNPNTHRLERKEKDGFSLLLNTPASRCLSLLIQYNGEVVSQDQFFREVWHQNGMNVSPNTLYQNISILRRSLDKCGLSSDIIVTVPRKGFTLSPAVMISLEEGTGEVSLSSALNFDQGKHQEDAVPGAENKCSLNLTTEKKPSKTKQSKIKNRLIFILAGCGLFWSGVLSSIMYDKINNVTQRDSIKTHESKWYLTSNILSPQAPLVRCQSPLNDTNRAICLANYYLISQHESN